VSAQRPVHDVPVWVSIVLAVALTIQVVTKAQVRPGVPKAEDLPPPPRAEALQIAALGEPATVARLAMLYLQSFDYHGSNNLPYRRLDYPRLIGWLGSAQGLDPRSGYPLFLASRVYAEVPDKARQRLMLEFIYSQYQLDPDRRWPALAHGALIAKHRLNDPSLALKYAEALGRVNQNVAMPAWARQMRIFVLEDMNELEAARIMIGGLLATGNLTDQAERRFLERHLSELEQRLSTKEGARILSNPRQR
jgi:hypothetical protein